MDSISKPQATPSPAELYSPRVPSRSTSSPSGYSLPIRAPPTLDSDFEYSKKRNNSTSSYTSDSDYDDNSGFDESEGFVSGEDGFETASEMPSVADPDDGTLGENSVLEGIVVSRPFVMNPDEKECEINVSKPFVFDSDDEKTSRTPMEEEEEEEEEYTSPRVKVQPIGVSSLPKLGMPIAQLSADSDDDSVSSFLEDDGFLGPVRVPSVGFIRELNSAPKVIEPEVVEDLISGEIVNGVSGSYKDEGIDVNDSVKDSVSVEAVDDKGLDVNQEEEAESSGDVKYTVEEIQALEEVERNMIDCENNDVFNTNEENGIAVECVEDKEVVVEDTGSALIEADENADSTIRADFVSESNETNPQGMEVEVKEVDTNVEFDAVTLNNQNFESAIQNQESDNEIPDAELEVESEDKEDLDRETLEEEEEGSLFDEDNEGFVYGNSDTAEQMIRELEQRFDPTSLSDGESSKDFWQRIDGQIVQDSDEEAETDEENEGKELFDSAALAALFKAATSTGLDGGNIMFSPTDGSRIFSLERPASLGSTVHSFRPTLLPNGPNAANGESESEQILSKEDKKRLEEMQQIRVKFLRLVKRLELSVEDSIAGQVLYRLALAAGVASRPELGLESAKNAAIEAELEGKNDLRFSLNILVIGKTGVGKSATINSIFGEEKAVVNAFEPETNAVKEIVGTIDGVEIRVLDTPGLRSSLMEQSFNKKILSSIMRYTKKFPPDVVLYVDRVDSQTRDLNDLPLLKSITSSLGSSIWSNAIVTLTHAASTRPDRPNRSPISYKMLVAQRSHAIQQLISHTADDLHVMNSGLMNPVALVENHPCCKKNGGGEFLLPNGESWRPKLLLLCYSMKILSEANSVKKGEPSDLSKIFGFRMRRPPPLSYFLSPLLQSNSHPKLSADQGGDDSDLEFGYPSYSDQENEDEYDQLPPFISLRKTQIANLSKEQRNTYFEEYDYRVKLLQKKQLREMKNRSKDKNAIDDGYIEEGDQETEDPSPVSVPLPDMALPLSFDGDNPAYRYRYLEPTSQILIRPVLDSHGWDHDQGYNGVSLDQNLAIGNRFPAVIAVQITKDKKEFNVHLDSAVSTKLGENGSNMAGLNVQSMGKQLAYVLKGETKFKNLKTNKMAAGASVTFVGENVVTGLKVEDQLAVGNRLVLVGSTGAIGSRGDLAYGTNLELRVRERDFPMGQDQSMVSLSLVRWKGELTWGCNLQSQFSVGRNSKMAFRAGLNNRRSGQISIKTSCSDPLQIALVGLIPIVRALFWKMFLKSGEKNSVE